MFRFKQDLYLFAKPFKLINQCDTIYGEFVFLPNVESNPIYDFIFQRQIFMDTTIVQKSINRILPKHL